MIFFLAVLAQLIVIPLVAIILLQKDKTNTHAQDEHWEEVRLVDLPEGITTPSQQPYSRHRRS
ncbi:MAG: hypothetical protein ACFCUI_02065 [Bernardetiaceae bacterium]